ncbi:MULTISPECIES: restriction endonuclease subunit S [unclassified Pseudoalteromonas]|uniref:restriction endonuclease subunit S n=1 Tax=unclassified Pseudoalteromonas TaxID=194690 RepID=UPI0004666FCC|nr:MULTISPECIES: restriction endonuclease subunit S [unclassified Pseudoalteromonas]
MNKLVPKLRFPTPLVKYKRFRFGDLVSIKSNKFNPAIESFVYPCIELEHISQGTGILLGSVASDTVASQKNKFGAGDILFSKLRPYLKKYAMPTFTGICSSEIWVMKTNSLLEHSYLYQYIQTDKFIYEANKSSGSKMPRSDWGVVSELSFYCPSKLEQEKIADFLTSVDTKISQLTEKHRLLKDYKKGVMQQVFSQKIRFKDDDGNDFPNWNEYALRDILILQSDALKMDDEATYELITVKRGFGGVKSRGHFKGKDVLVKNQFTIHKGEFVISKRQIVHGACGLVPEELDGAIVSNEYNVFRPQSTKLDIDYFNRLSTTLYIRRAFFINSDGVHIEKLLFKTQSWLKTKVQLPCLKEQQKIAQFLEALDKKTNAVNEQIEQTKLFKKGLLQQMFV